MNKPTRNIILFLTTCFVLLTIYKSFYFTNKYGLIDLRTRVVNTRLITTEHSSYFYKWKPADGEYYLDPVDKPERVVNGNVVTPAVMTVLYPLCLLPYPKIALIWTALQLLAGLAIVYLLFKSKTISLVVLQGTVIILGLFCSNYLLFNIQSGQMYIFYTFFFALMYWCYISKWKYNEFASGFIGGLFIFFRPFAVVAGLGFLLHGKFKWVKGAIAGALTGILVFVLPQLSRWQDYMKAMQEYVKEIVGTPPVIANAAHPVIPSTIEGATNLSTYPVFGLERMDVAYYFFQRFGITLTATQCYLAFAIVLFILSVFFFRLRKKDSSPATLFLFAFLCYMLFELFTPAARQEYNVIQWMFPLSLILLYTRPRIPVLIIVIANLLVLHNFPFYYPKQGQIAEALFIPLTIYAIFFSSIGFEPVPTKTQSPQGFS